eukprot:208586-Karenia_brevis.AAC.1
MEERAAPVGQGEPASRRDQLQLSDPGVQERRAVGKHAISGPASRRDQLQLGHLGVRKGRAVEK